MLRSEKVYTIMLVVLMSLVVIISVFFGIRQMKGEANQQPEYKTIPPRALVEVPPPAIVDITNTISRPISDKDFELFHKQTRILSPLLISKSPDVAKDLFYNKTVEDNLNLRLQDLTPTLKGQKIYPDKKVAIKNPEERICDLSDELCQKICQTAVLNQDVYVCQRAQSTGKVRFVPFKDGVLGSPTYVAFTWEWVKDSKTDKWVVIDIMPNATIGGSNTGGAKEEPAPGSSEGAGESIDEIDKQQNPERYSEESEETEEETPSTLGSPDQVQTPEEDQTYVSEP